MGHILNGPLKALHTLRAQALGDGVPRPSCGVCGNLYWLARGADKESLSAPWPHAAWYGYVIVQVHAVGWPDALRHRDGDLREYFVPHVDGWGLWEGLNLHKRIELIDYLIGQIQATIDGAVLPT